MRESICYQELEEDITEQNKDKHTTHVFRVHKARNQAAESRDERDFQLAKPG
jgi:hypothetical protein